MCGLTCPRAPPSRCPAPRAQVCTELENHVGVGDKTLAEFIINLAEENEGLPAFQRALESNGAEFPDSFVVTLHGAFRVLARLAHLCPVDL